MSKKPEKKPAPLPRGAAPGKPGRLPVAPAKAAGGPARLARRGDKNVVAAWNDKHFKGALDDLPAIADEVVEINKQIAALKVDAELRRKIIGDMMAEVKGDESWTVRSEDDAWIATYIKPKPGKKLEPTLLLQAGVTKQQLERGYKPVPAKKPYVQVRTKGEDTDSNEEHE